MANGYYSYIKENYRGNLWFCFGPLVDGFVYQLCRNQPWFELGIAPLREALAAGEMSPQTPISTSASRPPPGAFWVSTTTLTEPQVSHFDAPLARGHRRGHVQTSGVKSECAHVRVNMALVTLKEPHEEEFVCRDRQSLAPDGLYTRREPGSSGFAWKEFGPGTFEVWSCMNGLVWMHSEFLS